MNIGCAILAGGTGSRFGGVNKALVKVEGAPIISRILSVVAPLFSEISVISGRPEEFIMLKGVDIISDRIRGVGPMGGIYTAMEQTHCDALFIIAGDMPFLSRSFIQEQCELYLHMPCDALVPRYFRKKENQDGSILSLMIEPLHSIYSKALAVKLKRYIANSDKHSVWSFIESVNSHFMDISDDSYTRHMFTNLNRKEDLLHQEFIIDNYYQKK